MSTDIQAAERRRRSHNRSHNTVPTQLAAMLAGVTEATIRKWASRGKLTRYGRPGRAEYDIEELYALVVEGRGKNGI